MKGAKGVKMPRGDISLIKEYNLNFPSLKEQKKIADCLSSLDDLITSQSKKIEALKLHKKGLMQQLCYNIYMYIHLGFKIMKVKVSKWGNSLGLRLPINLVKSNILNGDLLDLKFENGVLTAILVKEKKDSKLEKLLEGITPENYGGEIDFGSSVGKEIW